MHDALWAPPIQYNITIQLYPVLISHTVSSDDIGMAEKSCWLRI
jgi:hypothetical protein